MATQFSKETYLYWYELMQLIRQFELMAEEKYKMEGKIRGFFHAYVGQEAIAAGCMTATRPEDLFITAYRDHGLAIAKGVSVNSCMAELYGKSTGCAKGKGGSMHFFGKGKRQRFELPGFKLLIPYLLGLNDLLKTYFFKLTVQPLTCVINAVTSVHITPAVQELQ